MAEGELDFSAVLSKLMNDKNVAELIGNIKANAENGESTPSKSAEATVKAPSERSETGGGSIAPSLMEKLPEVMAVLGPLIKNESLNGGKNGTDVEKRNCLLLALKPYLNESRRDMIDSIMTLSRLTSLVDLLPRGKE